MTAKKKKTEPESKSPAVKRAMKPERCTSHKFIMERDGRVDMAASHEVTDDSICFNCGLYFSTWLWYSNQINKAFWDGVDNEAGQTIIYVANKIDEAEDKITRTWGEHLLEKLRDRRKKNGRKLQVFDGSNN